MSIDGWHETTVEQIASTERRAIAMGPFGSNIKKENYQPTGVPVIRGLNLTAERFLDDEFVFLSEDKADELLGANAFPEDVVFTAQGTIGQVGIIPQNAAYKRYVLSQNLMKATFDKKKVEPLFIFYYFRSPKGQNEILAYTNPTGVPCISRPLTSLKSFRILLPTLSEQRKIARILSTLDDKIELNRRINVTLEEITHAIFKSWFVNFDPVRARAEGRAPEGLDREVAALFPDSFEDSELGKIPKGWSVGTLGEIGDNPRRGILPEEVEPNTPYIGLEHMPRRSVALSDWGIAGEVSSNKFRFSKGEILFGKLRPYFHKIGIAVLDGVCSTDILVVTPKDNVWFGLLLSHLSSEAFISYVTAASTGTKMPRTNWNDMARHQIVLPTGEITKIFNRFVFSIVQKINNNIWQSRTLATIRDALLPKLMSGEIRVKL